MWMSRNLSLFFSLASGKGRTASDDVAPKRIPDQRPVCVGALLTYYIYKNYCGYTGYGHGQSQELTQHTVVKRQRLLADVSAAMVGYAVSTFVLRQRLVRVDVQRREEQHWQENCQQQSGCYPSPTICRSGAIRFSTFCRSVALHSSRFCVHGCKGTKSFANHALLLTFFLAFAVRQTNR